MACPLCDDTGWKTIEVDGVSRVARCECVRERAAERNMSDARIPPRYQRCTLDNFVAYQNEELMRAVGATLGGAPAVPRATWARTCSAVSAAG